jgi:hypothetical protein
LRRARRVPEGALLQRQRKRAAWKLVVVRNRPKVAIGEMERGINTVEVSIKVGEAASKVNRVKGYTALKIFDSLVPAYQFYSPTY